VGRIAFHTHHGHPKRDQREVASRQPALLAGRPEVEPTDGDVTVRVASQLQDCIDVEVPFEAQLWRWSSASVLE